MRLRLTLAFVFPRVFGELGSCDHCWPRSGLAVGSVRFVAGSCRVLIDGYASGSRSERGMVQEAVDELFCPADTAPGVIPEG